MFRRDTCNERSRVTNYKTTVSYVFRPSGPLLGSFCTGTVQIRYFKYCTFYHSGRLYVGHRKGVMISLNILTTYLSKECVVFGPIVRMPDGLRNLQTGLLFRGRFISVVNWSHDQRAPLYLGSRISIGGEPVYFLFSYIPYSYSKPATYHM